MKKKVIVFVLVISVLISSALNIGKNSIMNTETEDEFDPLPSQINFGSNTDIEDYFSEQSVGGTSWEDAFILEDIVITNVEDTFNIHNTDVYMIFRNVTFANAFTEENLINITDSENIKIENCTFSAIQNVILNITGNSKNIYIQNNTFLSTIMISNSIIYTNGSSNITINDNLFDDGKKIIESNECENVTIERNIFQGDSSTFQPITITNSSNVAIIQNILNQTGSDNSMYKGLRIIQSDTVIIDENIIEGFYMLLEIYKSGNINITRNTLLDVGIYAGTERTIYLVNSTNEYFYKNSFSSIPFYIDNGAVNLQFDYNYYEGSESGKTISDIVMDGGTGYFTSNYTVFTNASTSINDTRPMIYPYGHYHVDSSIEVDPWIPMGNYNTIDILWTYIDNIDIVYDQTNEVTAKFYIQTPEGAFEEFHTSSPIGDSRIIWVDIDDINKEYYFNESYINNGTFNFKVVVESTAISWEAINYVNMTIVNTNPEIEIYQSPETWYIDYGKNVFNVSIFDGTYGFAYDGNPIKYQVTANGDVVGITTIIDVGEETNITIPIVNQAGVTEYIITVNDSIGGFAQKSVELTFIDQVMFTIGRSSAAYNLIEGKTEVPSIYFEIIRWDSEIGNVSYVTDLNGKYLDGASKFEGDTISYNLNGINLLRHGSNYFTVAVQKEVNGKTFVVHSNITVYFVKVPFVPNVITENKTVNNNSVLIEWNPVYNADNYMIYVNDEFYANTTEYEMEVEFDSEGTYIIKVYSYNEAGNSTFTAVQIIYSDPEIEDDGGMGVGDIVSIIFIVLASIGGAGILGFIGYQKIFKPRNICKSQGKTWNWKKMKC